MTPDPQPVDPARVPQFEVYSSRQFTSWLGEAGASIAFSSLGTGRLVLVNVEPDGRLKAFQRIFDRTTGLWADGQTLYLATLYQLWRFENVLAPGEQTTAGEDRLYVPMVAFTTGDLHTHDVTVTADARPLFANTRFDCLARPSQSHSFDPVWRPPFLPDLAPADRCHLTGVALVAGSPAYVTCGSWAGGDWRQRVDSGVVVDVRADEIVARGLSMPHSPRWDGQRLWLANAGSGEVGYLDLARGVFEPVAFCPGFLRGMTLVGRHAVVGSSGVRENRTFTGLALDENLRTRGAEAACGLYVIDLEGGEIAHWLRFEGIVDELYDVLALPGVQRARVVGLRSDEICRTVTIGPAGR